MLVVSVSVRAGAPLGCSVRLTRSAFAECLRLEWIRVVCRPERSSTIFAAARKTPRPECPSLVSLPFRRAADRCGWAACPAVARLSPLTPPEFEKFTVILQAILQGYV
ncbi:MAG: hypothetical protein ACK528_09935, partial [Alphaproteobacteria bacterium]